MVKAGMFFINNWLSIFFWYKLNIDPTNSPQFFHKKNNRKKHLETRQTRTRRPRRGPRRPVCTWRRVAGVCFYKPDLKTPDLSWKRTQPDFYKPRFVPVFYFHRFGYCFQLPKIGFVTSSFKHGACMGWVMHSHGWESPTTALFRVKHQHCVNQWLASVDKTHEKIFEKVISPVSRVLFHVSRVCNSFQTFNLKIWNQQQKQIRIYQNHGKN